jgi:hypothetical protein
MSPNRRKHRRITLDRPCWIALADRATRKECILNDVSEHGARLIVPIASDLHDRFDVHFTRDGSVSFSAKIVWRNGDEVGVRFVGRPKHEK